MFQKVKDDVFFICLLRGLRIISCQRFERLLFGTPEVDTEINFKQ